MNTLTFHQGDKVSPSKFICIPIELFSEQYKDMSNDAKILYGLMRNRIGLSVNNPSMLNEFGEAFIYFSQTEVQKFLNCANQKAQKILKELESFSLIIREKIKSSTSDRIYVHKLSTEIVDNSVDMMKTITSTDENHHIESEKSSEPVMKIISNKDLNNKDLNKKNEVISIYPYQNKENRKKEIRKQIDYDCLHENYESDLVDTVVNVMSESDNLNKINMFHVEYVLDCLKSRMKTGEPIRNIHAYIKTSLTNALATMDMYYEQQVKALFDNPVKSQYELTLESLVM